MTVNKRLLLAALGVAAVALIAVLGMEAAPGGAPPAQAGTVVLAGGFYSPLPEPPGSHALAAVPGRVNFQGLLTNPSTGKPVADGSYNITFSIWDAAVAGTKVWEETQVVAVSGGLFSVQLGSVTALGAAEFNPAPRYLEVKVGADPAMAPRLPFDTVPYAFHAETANSANSAEELAVGGTTGLRIEVSAAPNVIGGYSGNNVTAGAEGATISGGSAPTGFPNSISDSFGTIGGGSGNLAGNNTGTTFDAPYATVGGGVTNRARAEDATVAGGAGNIASGLASTIGGGMFNRALNEASTVAGGDDNEASGMESSVGGGLGNLASGGGSTVAGGDSNKALGGLSAVGGGNGNWAGGWAATVPGGQANTADGDYSFASGRFATIDALHDGSFLFADQSLFGFNSAAANEFAVRSTGGSRIVTAISGTGTPTAGVKLDPGDTAWEVLSDRDAKENFAVLNVRDVLERLSGVPITEWNYKAQDDSIRHIGPAAQDFYAAFGLSDDELYISPIDTDGVALAAIQGLYEIAQEKDAQIAALEERIDALQGGDRSAAASAPSSPTLPVSWLLLAGLLLAGLGAGSAAAVMRRKLA